MDLSEDEKNLEGIGPQKKRITIKINEIIVKNNIKDNHINATEYNDSKNNRKALTKKVQCQEKTINQDIIIVQRKALNQI